MKISSLLKSEKLSLSFEVFPPKTESNYDSVKIATEEIAKLHPSFMSVTYGAGGGTSRYTLEIAKNIKERYGVPSVAHLTCVSSTKQTVAQRIADIRANTTFSCFTNMFIYYFSWYEFFFCFYSTFPIRIVIAFQT